MSKYAQSMVKLAEYASHEELADLLVFMANLPHTRTARAALQNAAHRVRFDAQIAQWYSDQIGYDQRFVKIDGREG
jgi:hypothetical protein